MKNPIQAFIAKYGDDVARALTRKAPAIEGEVVGDLVVPAAKKVIPDIEAEVIQNVGKATNSVDDIVEESLPYVKQKQSLMQTINDLSPTQKAAGTAGIIAAASAPLFYKNNSPETSEIEGVSMNQQKTPNNIGLTKQTDISAQSKIAKKSSPQPKTEQPTTSVEAPSYVQTQPDEFQGKLDDAREQDRQNQMLFGLLKASQMAGSALASGKANTEYADSMLADKNKFATQLKTDMDMTEQARTMKEKESLRDPNSDISRQAREMLGKVYPDLLAKYPNITAEQLEKMGMNLGTLAATKENIAARKENAALQREMLNLNKQEKTDIRNSKVVSDHIDKYTTLLHKDYQNLQSVETNAKRAKDMLDGTIAGITPGATDIALLYNFIKGLDKNSAVREGEIALSKQARSVLGRLDSEVNRLTGGDLLDNATRSAFAELIDASAKAEKVNFAKQKRNAIAAGIEKGADPETLNRAIYSDVPIDLSQKSTTINETQSTPNIVQKSPTMVKVVKPDNSVGFIPADKLQKALNNGYKEVK